MLVAMVSGWFFILSNRMVKLFLHNVFYMRLGMNTVKVLGMNNDWGIVTLYTHSTITQEVGHVAATTRTGLVKGGL